MSAGAWRALALAALALAAEAAPVSAECDCVAIAGEVAAAIQADVARADGLYVRGDFAGAAALYAGAYATSPSPALLYAHGMAAWKAGDLGLARARLAAYLEADGELAFRARAQAALAAIERDGGAGAAVAGGAVGVAGGVVGGLGGLGGTAVGAVADTGVGAIGDLRGAVDRPKPKRLARGAAILLGVVAVGAVGAVGIHGLASLGDDIEFDTKFGLGLGRSGAGGGGTAIYLYGLTAAVGATAAAPCLSRRPLVTPVAYRDGAGLAAVGSF